MINFAKRLRSSTEYLPAGRQGISDMHFVYAIYSQSFNRRYIGITTNIPKRLKQHNSGKTQSTKPYVLWVLLFYEEFESRIEARNREVYLKSGIGREWLDKKFK